MAEEMESTENQQAETNPEKTYSEAEYTALQNQLNDANKTIQSFQDMDIESIKKSAEDWKQKAEQLEADQKEKEYSDRLDKFVQAQGMKNPIYAEYLKNQLIHAELKFKDDMLIGGEDIVKKLKADYPDAFADTQQKPKFVDSTSGNTSKTPDDDMIRKIMGLK
ncbi:MAG: phage scaffolding protein [Oscillospiraceae bacterium]|nr:phage scaffolding protein [Oscillospiraceae bacterium]